MMNENKEDEQKKRKEHDYNGFALSVSIYIMQTNSYASKSVNLES